jgi:4-phosphopantoate--beta-alanine ligase
LTEIPRSHPRYASLLARERVAEGVKQGYTSIQGLIAQGRGECFDYLLGERTTAPAEAATRAAAALLLLAERPALSVNGNVAALAAEEVVALAESLGVPLEVNLFHRSEERVKKIADLLRREQKRWESIPMPISAWSTRGRWRQGEESSMPTLFSFLWRTATAARHWWPWERRSLPSI